MRYLQEVQDELIRDIYLSNEVDQVGYAAVGDLKALVLDWNNFTSHEISFA